MTTLSPSSRLSSLAILVALITFPYDGTSFPISRIPIDAPRPIIISQHAGSSSRQCIRQRGTSTSIYAAVDMPMRPEERERNSNRTTGEMNKQPITDVESSSTDTNKEKGWTKVVGGFVPKFLKRSSSASADNTSTSLQNESSAADGTTNTDTTAYPTIQLVDTLEDYKRVVVDEKDNIVVVRFFAPWCKSCKASMPLFKKMVAEHASSSVKFVEVPLTKDTAYIHEGLGVPSVPFGHVYYPNVGLVEEKKINKKVFKEFRDALDSYVMGYCDLPVEEEEVVGENMTEDGRFDDDDGGFQ